MGSPEANRNRRHALAQAQGKTVREYKKSGLNVNGDQAAYRREYKRLQRQKAGCQRRSDIAANAQAKRDAKAVVQERKTLLHDAHVKRYTSVIRSRKNSANNYRKNPQAKRDYVSQRKFALPDQYIKQQLKSMGIGSDVITPSLIELKREAMQYGRLTRHIKTTLKENYEAITKHP